MLIFIVGIRLYVRQYGDQKIYKVAGGANVDDYHWTENVDEECPLADGWIELTLLCPSPRVGEKGSALAFDEAEWIITCQKLRIWMN